jgi:hypothetical protein
MGKIKLFAVAATLAATGFGLWTASNTNARVAPSIGQGIDTFQLMRNAKGLATAEFYDHGFVFH